MRVTAFSLGKVISERIIFCFLIYYIHVSVVFTIVIQPSFNNLSVQHKKIRTTFGKKKGSCVTGIEIHEKSFTIEKRF